MHSDAASGNQWYNQNGLIASANNQDYTVTVNGDYYSIVTLNGCSSQKSNTIQVSNVGIENNQADLGLNVYPNPVHNELVVEIKGSTLNTSFELINATGQLISKGVFVEKTIVQTAVLSPGIYLLVLESGKTYSVRKIVKE